MEKAELKSFGKPDEVREFPKGRFELLKIRRGSYDRLATCGKRANSYAN